MVVYANLEYGDVVRVISKNMDCMEQGDEKVVHEGLSGLYVNCVEGRHYLDAMVRKDGTIPELEMVP